MFHRAWSPAGTTKPGTSEGSNQTELLREDAALQCWSCRDAWGGLGKTGRWSSSLQKVEDFCLTNLISFYSKMTGSVGDEKVAGSCQCLP